MKLQKGSNMKQLAKAATILLAVQIAGGNVRAQSKDSIDVAARYEKLIDAENKHDISVVKEMLYASNTTLLVAKTKTKEEGGWGGFWGQENVGQHLEAVVTGGTFRIDPIYERERITFIKPDVAELYAPVNISVSYAGQNPVPKPFLMIIIWVKIIDKWMIQSDIAIPVPQA